MGNTVFITGGTRGIGRGLVAAFHQLGWNVGFSGRSQESVNRASDWFAAAGLDAERLSGHVMAVDDPQAVRQAWQGTVKLFGRIDVWINNAGMSLPAEHFWDLSKQDIDSVVDTNLKGIMVSSAMVVPAMIAQGGGFIYFMEGLGSDGRKVARMTLYGTTKYALAYFARALARETEGLGVVVGGLSPGMVVTDLLLADSGGVNSSGQAAGEIPEATRRIYNILADRVETVAPWLARRVDKDFSSGRKSGTFVLHAWLTTAKIIGRFLTAGFIKRRIV